MINMPELWYNVHHFTQYYDDNFVRYTKPKYTMQSDSIWWLQDMQVFGTIEQFTKEGYDNIVIDSNRLAFLNMSIVFIMMRKDRQHNCISIVIITKEYRGA